MMKNNENGGFDYKSPIENKKNYKKFFPACVDGFFKNPELIRKFGLSLNKKSDNSGKWPGVRSKPLHQIDDGLNNYILLKIFSVYFDLNYHNVSWKNSVCYFQEIKKYSKKKNDLKNIGWIHQDNDEHLAGIIYLNPNAPLDTGTSLYNLKEEEEKTYVSFEKQLEKEKFYSGKKISNDEYNLSLMKHNNRFYEKTKFNNVFNRLVVYDASEFHKANNFYIENENRLTLVFFVKNITLDSNWPCQKIKDEKNFDNHIENLILKNENTQSEKKLPE